MSDSPTQAKMIMKITEAPAEPSAGALASGSVNNALSATYNAQVHSDAAQAYLTGRIGLGVGMSYYTSPYGAGLAIMGLAGGALRAPQTYGSGLQLNHVIEGAIGGGGP